MPLSTSQDPQAACLVTIMLLFVLNGFGDPDDFELGSTFFIRQAMGFVSSEDGFSASLHASGLRDRLLRRWLRKSGTDDRGHLVLARIPELTSEGRSESAEWLSNLGIDLLRRFQDGGELDDIERAIPLVQRAVDLTTEHQPDAHFRLAVLGSCLMARYERLDRVDDITSAVSALRLASQRLPHGEPANSYVHLNLASALLLRHKCTGKLEDAESSINLLRDALSATPSGHSYESAILGNLGASLLEHFDRVGNLQDLNDAISFLYRAAALLYDHRNEREALINLGGCLERRYQSLGDPEDLQKAVWAFSWAVELTPEDHPDFPVALAGYGNSLRCRYLHTGEPEDLAKALEMLHKSIEITSGQTVEKYKRIANLSSAYIHRFERSDELHDIDRAIFLIHQALDLLPVGHPNRSGLLSSLSGALQLRQTSIAESTFDPRKGPVPTSHDVTFLDELDASMAALRRSIEAIPDSHPEKPSKLHNLGVALKYRFERSGCLDDLSSGIQVLELAVQRTDNRHYNKTALLSSLGGAYEAKFGACGDLRYIENAIDMHRRAVELLSSDHIRQPRVDTGFRDNSLGRVAHEPKALAHLGNSLWIRFEHLGEVNDLQHAIVAYRRALALTPDNPHLTPKWMNTLAICRMGRYRRLGDVDDLERAITVLQWLVERRHDGRAHSVPLTNLGNALRMRYELTGNYDDLEHSLRAFESVVKLTPVNHPMKSRPLANLAYTLRLLAERDHGCNSDVLQKAVSVHRQVVDLTPKDHPDFPNNLRSLGIILYRRLEQGPTQANFDETASCLLAVLDNQTASASVRMLSAFNYEQLMSRYATVFSSAEGLLEAHSRILQLIPEFVWLGQGTVQRYENTKFLEDVVNAAVATAIRLGALSRAVEWLEAGRSVIWSQALSLRTPLDELKKHHPDLHDSLQSVRRRLQQSGHTAHLEDSAAPPTLEHISPITGSSAADRHRRLALEYERLVAEVRSCHGFEHVLRPKMLAALIPSASLGIDYVVFVNVHSDRCDALIMSPSGEVRTVPLSELSLELATKMRAQWRTYHQDCTARKRASGWPIRRLQDGFPLHVRLLKSMWTRIVKPILQALNFMDIGPSARLPHVAWCPTGPLAQLPLHAAGVYDSFEQSAPHVFDFIVSSYTPSLSLLQQSSDDVRDYPVVRPTALVVTQPATPGFSPLPATLDERDRILDVLSGPEMDTESLNDKEATVESVRAAMSQHAWVHMSCHGSQNVDDPTQSAFRLYDGQLSLSDLMSTVADNAELAFLSACETATGDTSLPDESAHLAAGMLAVGFKGVIGTMWSIRDEDAPIIVESFYRELLNLRKAGTLGKRETGAAYALHEAAKVLREKVGESNFDRWVPFVHYGV